MGIISSLPPQAKILDIDRLTRQMEDGVIDNLAITRSMYSGYLEVVITPRAIHSHRLFVRDVISHKQWAALVMVTKFIDDRLLSSVNKKLYEMIWEM